MDMIYKSLKTPVAIASKYAVKTVTREVVSAAVSKTIYIIMRNEVARKISKGTSSSIFMMLGGYGIIEKASISKE
ncbi:hypothetical protein Q4S25_21905 [Morganella morganii]